MIILGALQACFSKKQNYAVTSSFLYVGGGTSFCPVLGRLELTQTPSVRAVEINIHVVCEKYELQVPKLVISHSGGSRKSSGSNIVVCALLEPERSLVEHQ